MALTSTQIYKDNQRENIIFKGATRLIGVRDRIVIIKAELLAIAVEIADDPTADAELKTLGGQVTSFMNNSKVSDLVDFITNNLE